MILYFGYSPGCAHCKTAEPFLRPIADKHPDLLVVRRNLELNPVIAGFSPKGTPVYVMVEKGQVVRTHIGILEKTALERFIDPSVPREPRTPRKPKPKEAA